jgi:hypothetical protein
MYFFICVIFSFKMAGEILAKMGGDDGVFLTGGKRRSSHEQAFSFYFI